MQQTSNKPKTFFKYIHLIWFGKLSNNRKPVIQTWMLFCGAAKPTPIHLPWPQNPFILLKIWLTSIPTWIYVKNHCHYKHVLATTVEQSTIRRCKWLCSIAGCVSTRRHVIQHGFITRDNSRKVLSWILLFENAHVNGISTSGTWVCHETPSNVTSPQILISNIFITSLARYNKASIANPNTFYALVY